MSVKEQAKSEAALWPVRLLNALTTDGEFLSLVLLMRETDDECLFHYFRMSTVS